MLDWIVKMLKGALIGVGAILPGISGGVLSVVLGVYKPLMAFLAHPIRTFKQYASMLVPILIGWVVGVVLLARVVDWLFRTSPTPAVWLFIGLVVGTLPALFQEAGSQGRPKASWVAFALGAVIMGAVLFLLSGHGTAVTPNTLWWLLCGAMWAVGLVVPGMSPSSFFIFFGLYQPMTAGIGHFDFSILIPMGIGLVLTIAVIARGMNALLRRYYPLVMHAILGIVVASTLAILPLGDPASFGQILLYVLCFGIGCVLALGMDKLGKRIESQKNDDAEAPAENPAKA